MRKVTWVVGVTLAVALSSLGSAQSPTPAPEPAEATAAEAPEQAASVKPFKLFESLAVLADAPPPEATEALRGQLQLMRSLRRGWYTGPTITGPIFEAWNAADHSPAASRTYYGVPYYQRAAADYYFGPPAAVGQQYSLGQAIGAALIQAVAIDVSHRY